MTQEQLAAKIALQIKNAVDKAVTKKDYVVLINIAEACLPVGEMQYAEELDMITGLDDDINESLNDDMDFDDLDDEFDDDEAEFPKDES